MKLWQVLQIVCVCVCVFVCICLWYVVISCFFIQIMDKAIVEIQNTANKLESMKIDSEDILEDLTESRCLIKDASNTKQVRCLFVFYMWRGGG